MPIDRDGAEPPLRRQDSKVSLTPSEGRGGDLRATPFTDDVFTDDYYGRKAGGSGGSKSYSVLIGIVLGVAVAAGAGWYFVSGSGLTFTPSEVGFVKADPTPYKLRPDDPGGLQVENQDKLVYDRVAKGEAPTRVENLLPPAEEPKAPPIMPQAEPPAAPAKPAEAAKPAAEAVAEPARVEAAQPEAAPAPSPPAAPAVVEAPKPAAPQTDPLAAAVAAATGGRTSATGPIAVAPPATPPPVSPPASAPAPAVAVPAVPVPEAQTAAAVPVPAPAAPAASGPAFHVQLASVLSEQAAVAEWGRISNRHKDILGSFMPAVSKADLGERGVFYRLRTGPLPDKAAADALCASLAAANVSCIVIRP